jgi:hypothetical protein
MTLSGLEMWMISSTAGGDSLWMYICPNTELILISCAEIRFNSTIRRIMEKKTKTAKRMKQSTWLKSGLSYS